MIAKFDFFNHIETPQLMLCSPMNAYENGVVSGSVNVLSNASNIEIIPAFNTSSELNFTYSLIPENGDFTLYGMIEKKRYVFVEDIGFFVIVRVSETIIGQSRQKEAQCLSCDIEIGNKKLRYIEDGTYPIMDLLNLIMETLPRWSLGKVAESLLGMHRTFEGMDVNLDTLTFLMSNLQDAFSCIFEFDILRRVVHVYDQNIFAKVTSAYLTHDTVISRLQVSEDADEVYTALTVLGQNDLDILSVNPLGTNTIYNFSYYKSWMSESLQSRLSAWEAAVQDALQIYHDTNLQFYQVFDQYVHANAEVQRLDMLLSLYGRAKTNFVSEESVAIIAEFNEAIIRYGGAPIPSYAEFATEIVNDINSMLQSTQSDINSARAALAALSSQLDSIDLAVQAIRDSVRITAFFTEQEYDELSSYISEGEYVDEFMTVTESMTHEERFAQAKTLYDRALQRHSRVAQPTYEFSVDAKSFVFSRDFLPITEQLETGCIVAVEINEGDVAELFLTSFSVNYEDKDVSLTFGNRFDRFDNKALFEDALGNIRKSANTVEYIKQEIRPLRNGTFQSMEHRLAGMRTLTKDQVLAATGQNVIWDSSGVWLRKENGEGGFLPEQMRIINNMIVLSDDGFNTARAAIGRIVVGADENGNPIFDYGVNASVLMGNVLVGGKLNINIMQGDRAESLIDRIESIRTEMSRYIIADERGLTLGRSVSEEGADAFILNMHESLAQFIKNGVAVNWINSETGITHTPNLEVERRISIGTPAFGPVFYFERTENGLGLKV